MENGKNPKTRIALQRHPHVSYEGDYSLYLSWSKKRVHVLFEREGSRRAGATALVGEGEID